MILLKNVLVATDFSGPSDIALNYGRELARTFGATLHVLHVVANITAMYPSAYYPVLGPDRQKDVEGAALAQVNALLTTTDRERLHAMPIVRTSATIAGAIVDYAKETQIDVIVVGTNGRDGVSRLFIGSVAERVVRTAPCPVLAVRQPEHEFIVSDTLVTAEKGLKKGPATQD